MMAKKIKNTPISISYSLLFPLISFAYSFLPTVWFLFRENEFIIIWPIVVLFYNLPVTVTIVVPALAFSVLLNLIFLLKSIWRRDSVITRFSLLSTVITVIGYMLISLVILQKDKEYQLTIDGRDFEDSISRAFLVLMIIPWPVLLGFNLYSLEKKREHWIGVATLLVLIGFFGIWILIAENLK